MAIGTCLNTVFNEVMALPMAEVYPVIPPDGIIYLKLKNRFGSFLFIGDWPHSSLNPIKELIRSLDDYKGMKTWNRSYFSI